MCWMKSAWPVSFLDEVNLTPMTCQWPTTASLRCSVNCHLNSACMLSFTSPSILWKIILTPCHTFWQVPPSCCLSLIWLETSLLFMWATDEITCLDQKWVVPPVGYQLSGFCMFGTSTWKQKHAIGSGSYVVANCWDYNASSTPASSVRREVSSWEIAC